MPNRGLINRIKISVTTNILYVTTDGKIIFLAKSVGIYYFAMLQIRNVSIILLFACVLGKNVFTVPILDFLVTLNSPTLLNTLTSAQSLRHFFLFTSQTILILI